MVVKLGNGTYGLSLLDTPGVNANDKTPFLVPTKSLYAFMLYQVNHTTARKCKFVCFLFGCLLSLFCQIAGSIT